MTPPGATALALLCSACGPSRAAWLPVPETTWLRSPTPPWKPHTGSIATTLANGSVLLLAGQAGEHGGALFDCFNCTNEVWHFDPVGASWRDLSEGVPWDPRWGHSALVTPDDTVWMFFGCCERGKPTVMLRDVWTFDPAALLWTRMASEPPFEGIQATSAALRGTDEIWVVGGWSQQRGTLSQVTVLSTATLEWTVKSNNGDAPWLTRADHATVISSDGTWLFLYGGQHEEGNGRYWSRLKDTWRVPLPGAHQSEWTQIGDLNAARSSVPVVITPTGWVISLGGHFTPEDEQIEVEQEDSEGMKEHHRKTFFKTYNDVLALDLTSGGENGWRVLEPNPPWPARDDCAAALSGGALLIFGGGTLYGGGGYLQDVWKLPDVATAYDLPSAAARHEL